MKVLLVSPTALPGGSERAMAGLARHLPALGIEARAVLLQDGPMAGWLAEAGCPVEIVTAGRARDLPSSARVVRRLAAAARGVDVVLSNQSKGHLFGGIAARLARRPEVWWQHGAPSRHNRMDRAGSFVRSAVVVVINREAVEAQRSLTPRARIELVHSGVDVAGAAQRKGSSSEIEAKPWNGNRVVGIVGRLQPWKGQEVFLRAAAIVAERHGDLHFLVVGGAILGWEGDYPERLEALAEELGIAGRVHFTGHRDDVYPYFDAMDVVVNASFGEPFGLVIVEAMALGKPVIATASGGPLDIIEDGVSGLLVAPGDHRQLADAIERVLTEPGLAAGLSAGAAERAPTFSDEAMAARMGAILASVA